MRYEVYSPERHKVSVVEYLKSKNLPEPDDNSFGIIVFDDEGNIKGCGFLKSEVYIEPFASDNYMSGFKLFNMLIGALISSGISEVYADISFFRENSYDVFKILRKLGFEIVNSGFTLKKKI